MPIAIPRPHSLPGIKSKTHTESAAKTKAAAKIADNRSTLLYRRHPPKTLVVMPKPTTVPGPRRILGSAQIMRRRKRKTLLLRKICFMGKLIPGLAFFFFKFSTGMFPLLTETSRYFRKPLIFFRLIWSALFSSRMRRTLIALPPFNSTSTEENLKKFY